MTPLGQPSRPRNDQTRLALELLEAGIPLSLLIDLATAVDSREAYSRERGAADWLPVVVA